MTRVPATASATFSRYTPRLFRLATLAAAAWLIHVAAWRPKAPDDISLAEAKAMFPTAESLAAGDPQVGGQKVLDGRGQTLGFLLTTSPHTDDIVGYAGPSNLLIGLSPKREVIGVRLLASGDTQAHVEEVRGSQSFWRQFVGASPTADLPRIEGVSGSTLTSLAMAEAIERRLAGTSLSRRFAEPVSLPEIQVLFSEATQFEPDSRRSGWFRVRDEHGTTLGYTVRTSPYSDNGRGYRGPTESLVAIAADGRTVIGLAIRKSYDTPEYVDRVREDEGFRKLLTGRTIDDWARLDFAREGIEGVSGATQTSFAVAGGMRRRFAADQAGRQTAGRAWWVEPGLLAIIVVGLALTFTSLRTSRRLKTVWQGVLIVVFLFWLGDLVSLALLSGWSRHGIPWRTTPAVVLLVAVALVVPWTTRRQIYCQQLCPHGAAQSWLGKFKRLHVPMRASWQRWLARLPAALLAAGLVVGTFAIGFDLAWLEPFDGWVLKGAAVVSSTIAVVGLVLSLFVPMAYCRYGCPTGELLRMLKSSGGHDRILRRDWMAAGLVAIIFVAVLGPRLIATPPVAIPGSVISETPNPLSPIAGELGGAAFGTRWSVTIRGQHDAIALQSKIAAELERIESTLSHWRRDSYTSQFNASETTLPTDQPVELVELVARSLELSRLSGGSYDITVAPLIDAWGYGPAGERKEPPSDEELVELLPRVGWQKLTADTAAGTLRKAHPQLAIDLGSLLQGYAADRLGNVLREAGAQEFLIDVGGELLASGSWQVAIEDPHQPGGAVRSLILKDQALATSGVYRTRHLISPQSGRPLASDTVLCAVVASTARNADAWASGLLAVGLPDAVALADEQQLSALFVDQAGEVHVSAAGDSVFGSQ
jgi:NosR/NirI family nitrous oxide reductase transcriptional regulator